MERYALDITEAAEPRPAEESWQLQYRRVDEVKSGRGNDAPGESLIPPLTVEIVALPRFSALCQFLP